ncbi:MAG: glycosyl transferase [Gammaproteobacteria bacterium]|nr:MAG: glycosyl transferase [Gammaproteobacteria bacterium]
MLRGENSVGAEVCENLLNSAYKLISEAKALSPQSLEHSSALNDICSLVDELSLLKQNAFMPMTQIHSSKTGYDDEILAQGGSDSKSISDHSHYERWLDIHSLTENQAQLMAERMTLKWQRSPLFALFVYVTERDIANLPATLESLSQQLYKNYSLTVISDLSSQQDKFEGHIISNWIQSDDIQFDLNNAIMSSKADWIGLIEAGDSIACQGLFSLADYDNLKGDDWQLIYTDEDYINSDGERHSPLFKPDINLDYLHSYPYIGHFCVLRKEHLIALGGYQSIANCCNEDLVLRTIEQFDESVIGHIADVLAHRKDYGDNDPLQNIDEHEWRAIVSNHMERKNIDALVTEGCLPKTNRVIYQYSGKPLVSVIIPTKNRPDLIEPCVTSLFEVTEYENFEVIIVDNGSDLEDIFYYYEQWQQRYGDRIRIIEYDKPFNFSAMNNLAAERAKGEYLVLLNNDTEIINGAWMERMLSHACRPDVGVVGARLLYPGGKLQHAGVIMGLGGSAAHPGSGDDFKKSGYMGRYQVDQNFAAVTAACFMTPRNVYQAVNGFDEDVFKILFNDVDYCLKVRKKGYRITWTPYATLVHKHSASLKEKTSDTAEIERTVAEFDNVFDRWGSIISADPAYNKNLSLQDCTYSIDTSYSPAWNNDFSMRPKVFAIPQDYFGCGNYRIHGPLNALSDASIAEVFVGPQQSAYKSVGSVPSATDILRMNPDSVFIQASLSDCLIHYMEQYKRRTHIPFVTDIDDLKTDLPDKNCSKRFVAKDVRSRLRKFLSYFDRLTVSTEPLAKAYKNLIDDVAVVPNRIDNTLWGDLLPQRRTSNKPRVGWVGAQQHHGDLEIIIDVVKQTAHEIDWIFMGMCLEELKPYIKEEHQFVSFMDYPEKMASLNLDLAVAPLEMHAFNEAKSNLRILEYGALGWPVVCTDIYPYQNAPVKRVNNTTEEWLVAIRERIYDLDSAAKEGDELKNWVLKHWILQDHLDEWMVNLYLDTRAHQISKIA